ncbi:MAG: hypothetical protein HPY83_07425 [Anaerolineae bacterium]|nr:hypothetical protein [Anaerolineae bacterium]
MEVLIADRLLLFWRMMAVVAVVTGLLAWRYLWLLGRGHVGQPGRPAGVGGVLRAAFRPPAGGWRRLGHHLWADGLLHRRLWLSDRRRWLAHQSMLLGFGGLALLSFFAALSEHVFRPLALDYAAIAALRDMDQPFLAALHETLGLLLLAGGAMAGLRRALAGGEHLPRSGPDTAVVALILFITASGYPVEALRLLMEQVPPEVARFSFVGWPLARWLSPLGLNWAAWHFWTFQVHVVASVVLFVYLPFSKMLHVFVSPVVAGLGAAEAEATR